MRPRGVFTALGCLLLSQHLLLLLTLTLNTITIVAAQDPAGSECFKVIPKSDNKTVIKIRRKVLKQFHALGAGSFCGAAIHMDSLRLNGRCVANADIHAVDAKLNAKCKAEYPGQTESDPEYRRCYWTRDNVLSKLVINPTQLGLNVRPQGENKIAAFDKLDCGKKIQTYTNV